MLPSSRTASGRILSAKDLLASSATGSARRLCHFWFESQKQKKKSPSKRTNSFSGALNVRDFIAVASLLWRNVETVHRTVSLSFSALLRNFFTPISGSSPLHHAYQREKATVQKDNRFFWRAVRDSNPWPTGS